MPHAHSHMPTVDTMAGNNATSTSSRHAIQPSELARAFAPRIEVASLAIRATSQMALFPDLVSSSPYHLSPLDHRRRPLASAAATTTTTTATARPSFSQPSLMQRDPSASPPPHPPHSAAGSGRRVTFSSDIDTIEICGNEDDEEDVLDSADSDSQTQDDSDELFSAGDDDDDNDEVLLLDLEDVPHHADDDDGEGDGDDGNNTSSMDHQAPPDTSTAASSLTTPSSTTNPPSPAPQEDNSHPVATTTSDVVLRMDPSKFMTEPHKPIAHHRHKGYRIMRDEVLTELAKRNRTHQRTPSLNHHPAHHRSMHTTSMPSLLLHAPLPPPGPTANNLRSVESQMREAILNARRYRHSNSSNSTPHPSVLPPFSSSSHAGEFRSSLLDELDRIAAQRDASRDPLAHDTVTHYLPPRYTERHAGKVIYATTVDDVTDEQRSATATAATDDSSLPLHEPVWKSLTKSSSAPCLAGPTVAGNGGGRLYLRVVAAENLDFPIDTAETPFLRCVLSNETTEYVSDYMPMAHTVEFNWDFSIDVMPDSEFTLTLQVGRHHHHHQQQQQQQQQQHHRRRRQRQDAESKSQLRKLFGNRRRSRTDSILRYVNRADGAIAQTRVSFASIEKQCRRCICTASFALVNGWYQFAKTGLLPKHRGKHSNTVPEKAVGKLTSKLFFLPQAAPTSSPPPPLPLTFDECEQGLNIQRYAQTCWQTGYMCQLGGDLKYWRRRFYSLRGWRLFSYTDTAHAPRTVIDLARAVSITADNRFVNPTAAMMSSDHDSEEPVPSLLAPKGGVRASMSVTTLGAIIRPSSASSSVGSATTTSEDDMASCSVKNSFRIHFETGASIDFFCDSALDRERWLDVLSAVIGHIPEWPVWMIEEYDDTQQCSTSDQAIHVPPVTLYSNGSSDS